jgi:hypothetical protein
MERVENLSDGLQQVECKSKEEKRQSAKTNWRCQCSAACDEDTEEFNDVSPNSVVLLSGM